MVGTGGANGKGESEPESVAELGELLLVLEGEAQGGSVKKDGVKVRAAWLCDSAGREGGTGKGGSTAFSAMVVNFFDNATACGTPGFTWSPFSSSLSSALLPPLRRL